MDNNELVLFNNVDNTNEDENNIDLSLDWDEVFAEIKGAIEQFDGKLEGWLGFFDDKIYKPKKFSNIRDLK